MVIIILFVISIVVRLLTASQSFWLDEGASVELARLPISQLLFSIKNDFHPPFFYLLLHLWLNFSGNTELFIRLPNIVFGALTIPALYFLLKEIAPQKKQFIPIISAFLLAINPLHIYYSVELRMYSLNTLLSVLSWIYLVKWSGQKKNPKSNIFFYLLISIANLYTFYGSLFNLIAQWCFVVSLHRNKFRQFFWCQILLIISLIPWLPIFAVQLKGGGYLTNVLQGWSNLSGTLSIKSLGLIIAKLTIGRISLLDKQIYLFFTAGISFYFLLCSLLVYYKKEYRILLIWFFIPLIVAIIISLKSPVLGYWRFLFLAPAFVSIIVSGLQIMSGKVFYLNLIIVISTFLFSNFVFWQVKSFQREDWRSAAKIISQEKSLTILNFPGIFAPLKFYASNLNYYPDQESLGKIKNDLNKSLPMALEGKETVFVLDYLSDLTDRERKILLWLKSAGFVQKQVHDVSGVGFIYEFKVP